MRLPSGRRIDLRDPTFADVDDTDLSLGLARTFRWGGHSVWPLPMSVAQHSLLVLQIRRSQCHLDPDAELRELLHDAEEGLLGFDPISPLKPILGDGFLALMEQMQTVLFARYGVSWWTKEEKVQHKKADVLAAASEAIHVAGWSRKERSNGFEHSGDPSGGRPIGVCVRRGALGAVEYRRGEHPFPEGIAQDTDVPTMIALKTSTSDSRLIVFVSGNRLPADAGRHR